MYSVNIYSRACLKDGMFARDAARNFNTDHKTIATMLRHASPSRYRCTKVPNRPSIDPYVGVIDEILHTDKALIKRQWHSAKHIIERLRDEHGYARSLTTVTCYVREQKRRTKEVFVPLAHRAGHAQVNFGETFGVTGIPLGDAASPVWQWVERKIHFLVMSLPHSNGIFVARYPAETTEAFCDGTCQPLPSLRASPNLFSSTTPRSLWPAF